MTPDLEVEVMKEAIKADTEVDLEVEIVTENDIETDHVAHLETDTLGGSPDLEVDQEVEVEIAVEMDKMVK